MSERDEIEALKKDETALRKLLRDWDVELENTKEVDMARITNPGLKAAIEAAGGMRLLAERLGIRWEAVQRWERVPAERLIQVARLTGIQPEILRPDLYQNR
jgi:hypothetical protein